MKLLSIAAVALALARPVSAQLAPANDLGVSFAHVHLNVTDVAANEELYSNVFGGTIVMKGTLHTVKFPNFLVVFNEREPTGPSQGTIMDHFGFKVRDIGEILAEWRARGLEVQSEFNGGEGFRNAYLLAPDGVRIERNSEWWPWTAAALNPGTSPGATAATSSPRSPAASPQPEPKTSAISWRSTPVEEAMASAAAAARSLGGFMT